jgi:aldehyde:ferredoxin oxidoreductase
MHGYGGRVAFVDLSTGEVWEERLKEERARQFIGGYGLGVRVLFEQLKKGADPLGAENILGFTTGPLTGTKTPTGGRYMAVCKSPLTGGWGDANSGGYFGSELKSAGWDALFVTGIAPAPRYLSVMDGKIELRDASHIWGQDTAETEEIIRKELNGAKVRVACIGPASERLSLISGIVNDKGRIAARSGVGAVMGSKRLKAVAVTGTGKVRVAHEPVLDQLRKNFVEDLRQAKGFPNILSDFGTFGLTAGLVAGGATPIENWRLAGGQAFPNIDKVADPNLAIQYRKGKYACANCPIACGGIFTVEEGPYPVKELHRPEYETLAAFGPMCMNDDFPSILKLTDLCNRGGLDTISTGTVLAFTMECYEKGIITRQDTDGIELRWGNGEAMIAMVNKMIAREGFGDILADGVKVAAEKIGRGAEAFAMHVGGQEPGFHNALFLPGRGTGFVCDPTPGRHTAAPMARIDGGPGAFGPYPELKFDAFERYQVKGKGPMGAKASCYLQAGSCAGICLFPLIFFGNYPLIDFLNAVTGWEMTVSEALETGARIQTLRQAFNIREGLDPSQVKLPPRLAGIPPKDEGPLAGITLDVDTLAREFREAMGWDATSGHPTQDTLGRLGLAHLVEDFG